MFNFIKTEMLTTEGKAGQNTNIFLNYVANSNAVTQPSATKPEPGTGGEDSLCSSTAKGKLALPRALTQLHTHTHTGKQRDRHWPIVAVSEDILLLALQEAIGKV